MLVHKCVLCGDFFFSSHNQYHHSVEQVKTLGIGHIILQAKIRRIYALAMKFQPLKKLVCLFFETTFLYSYNTLDNCKTNLYIPRVYRYFLYFLPRLL